VHLEADGAIMITGSHNPSEFNGFKSVCGAGSLHGETIQDIRRMIEARDFATGHGTHHSMDVIPAYLDELSPQFHFDRRIKVVADAGNGTAGPVIHQLLKRLNVEVTELFYEMDGRIPIPPFPRTSKTCARRCWRRKPRWASRSTAIRTVLARWTKTAK
jgi:phosphomannomutase/phosphoglucomutase